MKKGLTVFLALAFSFVTTTPAIAESKWTPISDNDYIFGYTSYKYSCWSGVTIENLPEIQVFVNNNWVTAAKGQILPTGSDIKTPCTVEFPIAVGFIWTVMTPAPPAYQTNRYTALYREKLPDKEVTSKKLVTTQVYEDQLKCCKIEVTSKKVPYIAKIKKNGKTVSVIKYKTVKSKEEVSYTESALVDQSEWQEEKKVIAGWTGQSANFSIYSSVNAMQAEAREMARAVLCAFGFSAECKK